jgi:hypothetical protein
VIGWSWVSSSLGGIRAARPARAAPRDEIKTDWSGVAVQCDTFEVVTRGVAPWR